jgi:hypothetical protein
VAPPSHCPLQIGKRGNEEMPVRTYSLSASTELSNLTSRVKKEPEVKNAIEYSIKAIRMYVKTIGIGI